MPCTEFQVFCCKTVTKRFRTDRRTDGQTETEREREREGCAGGRAKGGWGVLKVMTGL